MARCGTYGVHGLHGKHGCEAFREKRNLSVHAVSSVYTRRSRATFLKPCRSGKPYVDIPADLPYDTRKHLP
jgi:hypothetical protein